MKVCVATGGGIVLRKENWGLLQTGIVVWINMDVRDIVDRLQKDVTEVNKRPMLNGVNPEGRLSEILEQRKAMYKLVRCISVLCYDTQDIGSDYFHRLTFMSVSLEEMTKNRSFILLSS